VGSLWLGEPLGIGIFVGLTLVIVGVFLVVAPNRSTRPVWSSWRRNQK
jgi:drug/metabolite transporter (DMT)-like permease